MDKRSWFVLDKPRDSLQGGPGTGKSLLVDAVASKLNCPLLTVECGWQERETL